MAQITDGVRSILSHPALYAAVQNLRGAHQGRLAFVRDFVRPWTGMKVLDIGCGPADILAYLPRVDYEGFDISEPYIAQARKTFGDRGAFHLRHFSDNDIATLTPRDVVLAVGLLHHLDDEAADQTIRLASRALHTGGRFISIDPCFAPGQNPIAHFLVSKDRGQNVRDQAGYSRLAGDVFGEVRCEVRHQSWIPYTHCVMECTRT